MQENNSQIAKKILCRLKERLKIRTDTELSLILEVQPNTISSWKKRNTLDYSLIIGICKLYKIDLNELFYGEESIKAETIKVPMVTKETLHEYTNGQIDDLTDLPQYSLPFINNSQSRIFQVNSNNMFPVLEEDSFAICEKIKIQSIKNNSILAIVSKKKGFFIGRVEETNDALLIFNDNLKNVKPVTLKLEMVSEVWEVIGCINYNVDKDNRHLFNIRIQRLEAAINSSKKHLLDNN